MEDIVLHITIDETNLLLESLGNLPFVKVYALIGKIQEQAGQQLTGELASDDIADGMTTAPIAQE